MLPELPPDLKEALDLGITLFAGEAEGRMATLLQDIDRGELKPIYNYLNDLPETRRRHVPDPARARRSSASLGNYASFDAGRGCPFQCSFCTIINVQGRKSRYRTADDVEAIVRANFAQGHQRASSSPTTTSRATATGSRSSTASSSCARSEKIEIKLLIQVDTMCHRIPRFIEKVARAGCNTVYIGLENINPESLMGANKRQNKIWEYRAMLQAWRKAKVMIWAGYILGFPTDTPESIRRDIEIVKRELPIDIMEFMCLTPLPGSEDHKVLYMKGVPMDPDMNKYDIEHVCTAHPRMSKEEWEQAYKDAWASFYSRRACRDRTQARLRQRAQHEQGQQCADRVRRRGAHRGRAPDAVRPRAPQGAHAAPPRHADRQPVHLLSVARLRLPASGAAEWGSCSRCATAACASASSTIRARPTTSTSRCA